MKKHIKNLTQEIFKDRELLQYIGFSPKEATIFYHLIHGKSINNIANSLNISPYHIRKIRNRKFHLIPIYMRRKMALTKALELTNIYHQLFALETVISDCIGSFKKFYAVPVKDLSIPTRIINALIANGTKYTDQLCEQSAAELLLIRGIGEKAVREIESALERQGLALKISQEEENNSSKSNPFQTE